MSKVLTTPGLQKLIQLTQNDLLLKANKADLGTAAYTASTAYDQAGAASTAETNAKNYADGLASNYATAAQGAKADTAVQPSDLATVATTGDYDDLLNKPTIPSYSNFTGATAGDAGTNGLVPAPAAGDQGKFLQGDGTWTAVTGALPTQTGQSGKFLTTDGTDASWSDKPLVNEATNNIQLNIRPVGGSANTTDRNGNSIIIGSNITGGAYNDDGSIRVGNNINTGNYNYGTGIYMSPVGIRYTIGGIILNGGEYLINGKSSGKIGGIILNGGGRCSLGPANYTVNAKGADSIIINSNSVGFGTTISLEADYSTLINSGYSTTTSITEDNTFWWGNHNGVYKIVDTDGTIPEARLADTTAASQGDVLTLDSNGDAIWQAGGCDCVIEFQAPTSQNNYTWYRKYKSGWVEQGGITNDISVAGNSGTNVDVTLPITMADTNYNILTTRKGGGSGYAQTEENTNIISTSVIRITLWNNVSGTASGGKFWWEVKGMAA